MKPELAEELRETALAMGTPGKGILAADESTPTIAKRLTAVGVTSTPEVNNLYRNILLTTAELETSISGVILFDETLRQSTLEHGVPYPRYLESRGILPGIKVDKGVSPIPASPEESVTEGLDKLRDRFGEYRELGARFAKWRAVIVMNASVYPTRLALQLNAHALARYAALAQEAGLVPICEPEVLMNGDHGIDRSLEATSAALDALYVALRAQGVLLEGTILKPNMVLSGYECPTQASIDEVATKTLACLRNSVPAAVPSIHFLSGGQSEEDAVARLARMNAMKDSRCPWNLSFSFARALQHSAMQTWSGEESKIPDAQAVFSERVKAAGMATLGRQTTPS